MNININIIIITIITIIINIIIIIIYYHSYYSPPPGHRRVLGLQRLLRRLVGGQRGGPSQGPPHDRLNICPYLASVSRMLAQMMLNKDT